tara:strand:+ start:58 stop:183 length:126 start_codon:yes stop_codon:yes gene_type:complete
MASIFMSKWPAKEVLYSSGNKQQISEEYVANEPRKKSRKKM